MRATRAVVQVVAVCALATAAAPAQAESGNGSCAAQFATSLAPHSAGSYGATVSTLTKVFEPNFGQGGVMLFALAPRDACP